MKILDTRASLVNLNFHAGWTCVAQQAAVTGSSDSHLALVAASHYFVAAIRVDWAAKRTGPEPIPLPKVFLGLGMCSIQVASHQPWHDAVAAAAVAVGVAAVAVGVAAVAVGIAAVPVGAAAVAVFAAADAAVAVTAAAAVAAATAVVAATANHTALAAGHGAVASCCEDFHHDCLHADAQWASALKV